MARRSKWVAAIAAGGTALGVGAAIADMPPSTAAVPLAKVMAPTTLDTVTTVPSDRVQLAATVAEVNRLEVRIKGLRNRLATVSAAASVSTGAAPSPAPAPAPSPAPAPAPAVAARTVVVGLSTSAADQARLNSEQAQLVAEQAGLTAEHNALIGGESQLRSAQAALVAARPPVATTPVPTTHTTTGASSGKGNESGDN